MIRSILMNNNLPLWVVHYDITLEGMRQVQLTYPLS
jgi:hypothetical protein